MKSGTDRNVFVFAVFGRLTGAEVVGLNATTFETRERIAIPTSSVRVSGILWGLWDLLGSGIWGLWTLDSGLWTLDSGLSLDSGSGACLKFGV